MWWFTLFFGLFGLHHLLLRSSQTFVLFLVVNVLTLGYWWMYDLVQLSNYTTDRLNEEGLHAPWGPLGIAQGMWLDESAPTPPVTDNSPPNPWWFFAYALLIPAAPLSLLLAGDSKNALSRFLDLTVVPLGWIFYVYSIFVDYWSIFGKPTDFFLFGTKRTFPFPQAGMDPDQHSPRITGVKEFVGCPPEGFLMSTARFLSKGVLPAAAKLPVIGVPLAVANTFVQNIVEAYDTGKQIVNQGIEAASGVQTVMTGMPGAINASASEALKAVNANTSSEVNGNIAKEVMENTSGTAKASNANTSKQVKGNTKNSFTSEVGRLANQLPSAPPGENDPRSPQAGGGKKKSEEPSFTPTDFVGTVAIGAVILGGLTLGASRLLENGRNQKTDLPPSLIA
jgi:hypothetical protein